jgi:hypothetical protein
MQACDIQLAFEKTSFLEACANWRDYPSKPAIYVLAVNKPFKHGAKMTDILYIGETKHLGGIDSNCRLWDYHTKATQHEADIIERIREMGDAGKLVDIYWCCSLPKKHIHKEIEKHLLRQYREEHGRLPMLNRRE